MTRHAGGRPRIALDVAQAHELLASGVPASQVAERLGCSERTLWRRVVATEPSRVMPEPAKLRGSQPSKHARPRNVPHETAAEALERKRDRSWATAGQRRRVASPSGGWPTHDVSQGRPPGPPALCFIYDDLADLRQPAPVFGQYPRDLIPKILPWLRCERREVLHVCSGSLPPGEGIRVDISPEAHPDILADGRDLPLADGSQAAVMLDPPYTEHYAQDLYGVEYPRPAHLLREAARVVRPNGRIAFVHYITPNPPPGCDVVKVFGLSVGFGFPMRAVTIYERRQPELLPESA